MYDQYYGLTGQPFQLMPDPRFYFESDTHRKALAYLGYGLAQGEGFIIITGDSGAGKTMLVGQLMTTIDPQRLTALQIIASPDGAGTMLRSIAQAFGLTTDLAGEGDLLRRIEAVLHHGARAGRCSLLIVDEAQNLSPDALEHLLALSNVKLGGQSLLQIFLLCPPEFREHIAAAPELEQLRQHIIATHHLDRLQNREVGPYIEHHLRLVGWTDKPSFTPEAYALLGEASDCLPRHLNGLATYVLERAAADQVDLIDDQLVEAVIADVGNNLQGRPGHDTTPPLEHAEPTPESEANKSVERLRALFAEVRALNAAINDDEVGAPDEVAPLAATPQDIAPQSEGAEPASMTDLEERLARAEARLAEQDEVLRRILSKLIEWAERDSHNGPFSSRVA